MKIVEKLNKWANSRTNIGIDALRIGLGVFLFFKGIQFANDTDFLVNLINAHNPEMASMFIAHYITMTHFAGGILIAFGLLTRLSVIIQLPLLVGAVLVNFVGDMDPGTMLQAAFALSLALFFLAYGSGKHSVDYVLKMHV